MALGMKKKPKAPTIGLSKLNSMAFRLAAGTVHSMVGFAVRVTSTPRKTRFRPLVRRYRTRFPPAEFQRKVSKLFRYSDVSKILRILIFCVDCRGKMSQTAIRFLTHAGRVGFSSVLCDGRWICSKSQIQPIRCAEFPVF